MKNAINSIYTVSVVYIVEGMTNMLILMYYFLFLDVNIISGKLTCTPCKDKNPEYLNNIKTVFIWIKEDIIYRMILWYK